MSGMDKSCPICFSPDAALPPEMGQHGTAFKCLRCGQFQMTHRVIVKGGGKVYRQGGRKVDHVLEA